MKKGRLIVAAIIAAVLVLGVLAYAGVVPVSFTHKQKPGVVTVDSGGGTFKMPGGAVVIVPKGAVTRSTTLTMTAPRALNSGDAGPFKGRRTAAVAFDVSLSRGKQRDIQPLQPLTLTMPEIGAPKPLKPNEHLHVFPYTVNENGTGYVWLPSSSAGPGKINMQLPHLSSKFVTYVSDKQLLGSFFPESIKGDRGKCKQKVTAGGIKVKFGSRSKGWSLKDDSAIFACLATSKDNAGYVHLNILNRIDYILSVATTSNIRVATKGGNAETEVIKALTRAIFNPSKTKAFIGNDEKLVGSIDASDLPATLELQGDPDTFLAEAVWRALTVITSVFVGEGADEVFKTVKELVTSTSVVTCLQDVTKKHNGNADIGFAFDVTLGCTKPILEVLAKHSNLFDLLNRAKELWDLKNDLKASMERSWNGIKLSFANTLRVQVVAEPPPVPLCMTKSMVASAIQQDEHLKEGVIVYSFDCKDGWVVANVAPNIPNPANSVVVLHRESTGWSVALGMGDTDIGGKIMRTGQRVCDAVPPELHAGACY